MSIPLSELNNLITLRRYLFDASNGFFAGIRKDQIREVNALVAKIDVLIVSNASGAVEQIHNFSVGKTVAETMVKPVSRPQPIKSVSNESTRSMTVSSSEDDYTKSLAIIEAARKAGLLQGPKPNAGPAPIVNRNGSVVISGETFATELNRPHDFTQSVGDDTQIGEDDGQGDGLDLDSEHELPNALVDAMRAAKQAKLQAEVAELQAAQAAEAEAPAAEPTGIIIAKKRRGVVSRSSTP
jgi:hypothetical protein